MEEIKIDKNIELPISLTPILRKLSVGESFLVPKKYNNTIRSLSCCWQKKLNRKFSVRKTEDGLRVWRVK